MPAAEAELKQPSPDTTVLQNLYQGLIAFMKAAAHYCGKTLDTIVQEAAKSVGQNAGKIATTYVIVSHADTLVKVLGPLISP